MVLISKQVLGASAPSVTFSSIPQVFNHLRVTYVGRSDFAGTVTNIRMTFNGDTGANYDQCIVDGVNSATTAATSNGITSFQFAGLLVGTSIATFPSSGLYDILNYTNTTFYKTATGQSDTASTSPASTYTRNFYGNWRSTAAITSVSLLAQTGDNLTTGSIFYLYGIY